MARPIKQGLDYFPMDVDIFSDEKIKLINTKCGDTGIIVLFKLMCRIYRNGYYMKWDIDESSTFAKYDAHISIKKLDLIIMEALKRNFFDAKFLKEHGVLTSKGIQARYFTACKLRKSKKIDSRYHIVSPNDYGISPEVYSGITPHNSELTPQRKEKENKPNETREGNVSTLTNFYNQELLLIKAINTPSSTAYSALIAYILGDNELKTLLNGLDSFKDQLTFEQFSNLWDNLCGTLPKYQNAVLKIHENPSYQKGTSLFTRLKSWFEQDKQPETLNPNSKTPKTYTPQNKKINGSQNQN